MISTANIDGEWNESPISSCGYVIVIHFKSYLPKWETNILVPRKDKVEWFFWIYVIFLRVLRLKCLVPIYKQMNLLFYLIAQIFAQVRYDQFSQCQNISEYREEVCVIFIYIYIYICSFVDWDLDGQNYYAKDHVNILGSSNHGLLSFQLSVLILFEGSKRGTFYYSR